MCFVRFSKFFFCFFFVLFVTAVVHPHCIWWGVVSVNFDYCFLFWFLLLLLLMTTQQKIYSAANLATQILSLFDSRYLSQRLTINWNNPTTAFLGGLTTIFRLRIDFCRFYFWGVVCCFLFHGGVFFFFSFCCFSTEWPEGATCVVEIHSNLLVDRDSLNSLGLRAITESYRNYIK